MVPGSTRAGHLVQRPAGHFTFEPEALPPRGLVLSGAIYRTLSEADQAMGFLHGQVQSKPAAGSLLDLVCQQEAVASCQLEGSAVTLRDLLWWEFDGSRAQGLRCSRGDLRVCANYAALLREVPDVTTDSKTDPKAAPTVGATPVLRRSLSRLHGQLFRGVRGRDAQPGQIRTSEIWLGPRGSTLQTAHFVPPAPEHIPKHLSRLIAFATEDADLPPLARVAMISWQLETIHPFVDGSGRVTRLTLVRLLEETHGAAAKLLCPSLLLAKDLGEHFRRLQSVRHQGDWEGWLLHFGNLLRDSARAGSLALTERDAVLREHQEQILREQSTVRDTAMTLLQHLTSHPIVSVQRVAELCERTFANANLLVARLEALGILDEITGRQRHRRYVYKPFVALLKNPQ